MFKKSFRFLRSAFFTCLLFAATLFFCENFFCFSVQKIEAQSFETAFSSNLSTSTELVIESITAKTDSKIYDGTSQVELEVVVSNFAPGDNVSIQAYGHTADANVGQNKYVFFDTQDFVITSLLENEYTLPAKTDDDFNKILFTITKMPVDLTWVTACNPNSYVYNGQDQRNSVKAYYVNENEVPVYLNLSWTGKLEESNRFNITYLNEFKNHGDYKATAIFGQTEVNYEIGNSFQRFTMLRAQSQIEIVGNKNFTYNGQEQDASRNATMATLNNQEQTLTQSNYSDYLFTTVSEGNGLTVQISVPQSQNYIAANKSYTITVAKAISNIDISNIPTYTYKRNEVQYVEGATVNNTEQTVKYANNSFETVEEGNSLSVVAYVDESENYLPDSKTFSITVNKLQINAADYNWSGGSRVLTYDGNKKSFRITNYDSDLVYLQYQNATETNVGDYVASVKIFLVDEANCELIGQVENLNWSIKKAKINKPNITTLNSKYTGSLQYANISSDSKNPYVLINNSQTNAGNYKVIIRLKDLFNTYWADETIDDLYVDWRIEKKELSTPEFESVLVYNSKNQTISLPESNLYSVVENYKTEVGKYQTYLVLNDPLNYKWAESDSSVLTINWQIVSNNNYNTSTPVITIIIAIVFVVLFSISATLHFTIKAKRRRRKKVALQPEQESVANTNSKNLAVSKGVKESAFESQKKTSATQTSAVKTNDKEKKANVSDAKTKITAHKNNQFNKDKKQEEKSSGFSADKSVKGNSIKSTNKTENIDKSRKKRMISMKKKDKRKRRQDEIKKKVIAKRPPAKRGRPPKKKK